jgi:hypothetical protein
MLNSLFEQTKERRRYRYERDTVRDERAKDEGVEEMIPRWI